MNKRWALLAGITAPISRVLCDCPTSGLPCGCGFHSDDEQVVTFADDRLDLCWLCNERTEEGPTGLCGPCLDRKRAEAHG